MLSNCTNAEMIFNKEEKTKMEYYYAVTSGNIFRCVAAEDPRQACTRAYLLHQKDETCGLPEPGTVYLVAELGATDGDQCVVLAEDAYETA